MVLTLAIPLRAFYKLEDFVTMRHLDNMAKMLLATGLIVAYGYMEETFTAFYSGNPFDRYMIMNRMFGPYAPWYWLLITCNIAIPMTLLWSSKIRRNVKALFCLSLVVKLGMWLERFLIGVTSLHRDFVPSSGGIFYPTAIHFMLLFGTIGLFFTLFYLFIRYLPMISIFEMRELVHKTAED